MRILLTFFLFFYLNLSGFAHISGLEDTALSQACDEIKGDSGIPYQSSLYDFFGALELDEDSDFNEISIHCIYAEIKVDVRVDLLITVFSSNLNSPNLITFGADNSPPIS